MFIEAKEMIAYQNVHRNLQLHIAPIGSLYGRTTASAGAGVVAECSHNRHGFLKKIKYYNNTHSSSPMQQYLNININI